MSRYPKDIKPANFGEVSYFRESSPERRMVLLCRLRTSLEEELQKVRSAIRQLAKEHPGMFPVYEEE